MIAASTFPVTGARLPAYAQYGVSARVRVDWTVRCRGHLFDHLDGLLNKGLWNRHAEGPSSLEVYRHVE